MESNMETLKNKETETSGYLNAPSIPNLPTLKAKQKATWESGDFGQIAKSIENVADDFMSRRPLKPGARVLDVACGTGNLAVVAARSGCVVNGIDIAGNLLSQASDRAAAERLAIDFRQADAEELPFGNDTFDLTVSMFGVMFTPRPAVATAELLRVTKSGGQIALANWTLEGFIGRMFGIFKSYILPPAGIPSPMEWGNEATVQRRLQHGFTNIRTTRRIAWMRFPFPPADTVDFFRRYYGPTLRAFESLPAEGQEGLRRDLVELQTQYNTAAKPGTTEVAAEYLEIAATKI
jgi:2-polyprenyl-3-methyl-5-hydroxy-6-metoxy-1,4-benzoquinol methylase